MLAIRLIVLLIFVRAQLGQIHEMNSTWSWPGSVVTSFSKDQSPGHYHNVTDNGYGKVNIKSWTQLSEGWPGACLSWNNTDSYNLLTSTYYQFLLKIQFSIHWASWNETLSTYLCHLTFIYSDSEGIKQVIILLSTSSSSVIGPILTVTGKNQTNGTQVKLVQGTNTNPNEVWIFAENTHLKQSYNTELDVLDLFRKVLTRGWAKSNPLLIAIRPKLQSNNVSLNTDLNLTKVLSQITCCELSTITLSNLSVSTQVFQNISAPNYCKIFFNGSTLYSVLFGFNFQNTVYELKSYQFVTFGYLNMKWVTPISNYQLPFQLTNKAEINVNFTYGYTESVSPSNYAVCFTIVLRDDYDPYNKTFNLTRTDPSAEILVCPWWKTALPNSNRIKIIRFQGTQFYEMYADQGSWPVFTFTSLFPMYLSVQNYDLFSFVQEVLKYSPSLQAHFVSSIQIGFRAYAGMGAFSIQQCALGVRILPANIPVVNADCLIANLVSSSKPSSTSEQGCGGAGVIIYESANKVMSAPNLVLVVRMVCVLKLIDDLTYYAYHNNIYSPKFQGLTQLAWNLTSSKWMIPQLIPIYQRFNFTYKPSLSQDPTFLVPNSYISLEQDANFLRQTEEFWISSLPITIVFFVSIHIMYRILRCFDMTRKVSKILVRFSWLGFIIVSVIGDNIQYLSFRCFSQLYQLLPSNKTQLTTIIMSYVTLFVLMFYSGSAYFVLPKIIHKNSYLLIQGFRRKLKTVGYLTSISLLKVLVGYIHSALCHDGSSQIICLLLIQTIQLALLIICHDIYLCKFLFTCHLIENIFRTILHLLLCLETYSGMELIQNTNILEQIIGSFINYIFILCIADIFISNFFGGSEESAQKKKNIVQQNKQIKHQSQSNMVILQTRRVNIIELQNQENNKDEIIEKKRKVFKKFQKQTDKMKKHFLKTNKSKGLLAIRILKRNRQIRKMNMMDQNKI